MLARVVVVLVGIVAAGGAQAQGAQQWLCAADQATGFKRDPATDTWSAQRFSVENDRVLVRPKKESDGVSNFTTHVVVVFGNTFIESSCQANRETPTIILCDGFSDYKFNMETLKYLKIHSFGYVESQKNANTPFVAIGRCSPF